MTDGDRSDFQQMHSELCVLILYKLSRTDFTHMSNNDDHVFKVKLTYYTPIWTIVEYNWIQ